MTMYDEDPKSVKRPTPAPTVGRRSVIGGPVFPFWARTAVRREIEGLIAQEEKKTPPPSWPEPEFPKEQEAPISVKTDFAGGNKGCEPSDGCCSGVDDNTPQKERIERPPLADPVFRPAHYTQWFIEPLTFMLVNQVPFAEGSVIKYVMRWRKKNGLEDLRKARRILDMLIEVEENKADYTPKKRSL